MKLLIIILAAAIPGTILIFSIFIYFICCRTRSRNNPQFISDPQFSNSLPVKSEDSAFHSAIAKLRLSHKSTSKSSHRFHHLHTPSQIDHAHKQIDRFSWEDHPNLTSGAVTKGWARFRFDHNKPPISRSSPLWGICALCDGGTQLEFDEIKSEYMQTIRINDTSGDDWSSIRMSLPLPGPQCVGVSFPQEAYFEITILYLQPMSIGMCDSKRLKYGEDDKLKLIKEGGTDGTEHDDGDGEPKKMNSPMKKEGKNKKCSVSLGLTTGGGALTKGMLGTNQGSIGFHSDGCVYLDGLKLITESEIADWAGVNRVIGCGYNPSKKKVYFTVDSELVHVIRCNSDSYKNPLYPIISSNSDVMILVNLGQTSFKYAPANLNRTANPCLLKPSLSTNDSIIGYEDSHELFSMGKIDGEWLDGYKKGKISGSSKHSCRSSKRSSGNWDDSCVAIDVDGESDLFEISLSK